MGPKRRRSTCTRVGAKGRNVPGSAREVLNRVRHSSDDFKRLTITYADRGAPGDETTISGTDVVKVGRSFLELESGTMIPMHRIRAITMEGRRLFRRKRRTGSA